MENWPIYLKNLTLDHKELDEDKRLLHAASLAGHNAAALAEEHYVEDCEDHLEKC